MRFRLEATPDELLEKSDQLLEALHDAVAEVAPDAADRLEKALPRKESDLKFPVLRELAKRTSTEYERLTGSMLKEIGKVLDKGPVEKSLGQKVADGVKAVFVVDRDDLSKGWYCGHCGAVSPGDRCEHIQRWADRQVEMKKGLYIGPRGGKWADPNHTIPWKPPAGRKIHVVDITQEPETPPEPKVSDVVQNDPMLTDEQKAKPVSKALQKVHGRIDAGAAGNEEEWELPPGARIDDPWEPPIPGPTDKWKHPDYGDGEGPAPWQAEEDWKPDLNSYDYILVNSSSGKDSQAMLSYIVEHADKVGYPRDKIVVVHADLGRVEWEGSRDLAQQQAEHYGLRFEVAKREQNDLLEHIDARYGDLVQREIDAAVIMESGLKTWQELVDADPGTLLSLIGDGPGLTTHAGDVRVEKIQAAARQKIKREEKKLTKKVKKLEADIDRAETKLAAADTDPKRQRGERAVGKIRDKLAELEAPGEPGTWPVDFGKSIPWPSADSRYCTSDHKRDVIKKVMTQLAREHRETAGKKAKTRILNSLGIRAQESLGRRAMSNFAREADTGTQTTDRWYPLHRWHEKKVWDTIEKSGVPFHRAYGLGMRRLSCCFCIMSPKKDLMVSAMHNPELFKVYLELEEKVGVPFTEKLSLADVADEIKQRRDEGYELDKLAEWVKKALGLEDLDLVKAELAKPSAGMVGLLLEAGLARLGRFGQEVQSVTVEWKTTGACLHLDTAVDSHHIDFLEYPEAYNASMVAATVAQRHGLTFEEHNVPAPLEGGEQLEKALYIGPRGGKWADPAHTIPWSEKEHGKQMGLVFEALREIPPPEELVTKGMSLQEAEQAIYGQPVEHLAIILGDAAVRHIVGSEKMVRLTKATVAGLRLNSETTVLTHNHPNNLVLSSEDINLAVITGIQEMRAVCLDGTIYKITRPESGNWLGGSGESLIEFQWLLDEAALESLIVAQEKMDERIKNAGGKPGDETHLAFSQEVFDAWYGEESFQRINEKLNEKGYDWEIEVEYLETAKSTDERGDAEGRGDPGQGLAPEIWGEESLEKALYIGPRGGKWADPGHTIPWDPEAHGRQVALQFEATRKHKTVADIGPGITPEEVQEIIQHQDNEHLVLFDGAEFKAMAVGTGSTVRLGANEVGWLDETDGAVCVHNHPISLCFSDQDINMVVATDCKETRVICSDGVLYRLVRPEAGWVPGIDTKVPSLQLNQFQSKLQNAQKEGAEEALRKVYFMAQEGDDSWAKKWATAGPEGMWLQRMDTPQKWKDIHHEILSEIVFERFNEIGKEYGWQVEKIEPTAKSAEVWLEMDEKAGEALWDNLEKAGTRSHKYIRRVPYQDASGRRRYRYYYRESAAARAARVGEEIRLGDRVVRVTEIRDNGDITIEEVSGPAGRRIHVSERVTADAWAATLAEHYGKSYYQHAEKRARQAINAVLRHVPSRMLADLRGDTDKARLEDLKKRVPEVYDRLEAAFRRAGVNPFEAKQILGRVLERKGWEPEARALVIGNVITPEGAKLTRRYRQVLDAAENLAGGLKVEALHAASAVNLIQSNVADIAKRAEREIVRLQKKLHEAWERPGDMEKKAAVLAEAMAAGAVQQLNELAQAFPSLADRAARLARDTMLEVPSVAPHPPKNEGSEAAVRIAGEGGRPRALKAKYKLVEAGEVIPSHDPMSFKKHEKYPEGLQERAYHRDKAEQVKVQKNAQKMDAAFVVNTNPDAVNGPPIVTDEGIVLGGNSRTMSMQRIYDDPKLADQAEVLKKYLADHAYEVGLNPDDVAAMEKPILIRVVEFDDESQENLKVMVRAMNESFTQAMDPRTMQVAMGRRLTDAALDMLAKGMEGGETLNEFLSSGRASGFISMLYRAGIIDDRNVNQFMKRKTKQLNADGKVLVARILAGRVLDDADLLSETKPSLVESVAGAVPYMVQATGHGAEFDMSSTVRLALDAYNRLQDKVDSGDIPFALDKKVKDHELRSIMDTYLNDLFGDQHPILSDGRAQAMLDLLIRRPGPKQMRNVFKEYALQASQNPRTQRQLLAEVRTPEEVFRLSIDQAMEKEKQDAAAKAAKKAEKEARKKAAEASGSLFGKAGEDPKDEYSGPLIRDHTQAIAEKDDLAYSRVKQVLIGKGYVESDFEEGGPLYGWSVNQLIDLARDKRVD